MKESMDIGLAVEAMRAGHRVSRYGWNGKGQWVALQVPDAHSKMKRPYVYIHPVDGTLVPWIASQSDLLASDWLIVSDAP